jgi:hypothetical protein
MRARLRAGLIDLALSAAAAAAVLLPIYFFWYPGALYDLAGGRDLFVLLVAVQLVLGPLLTAILYVPGKWGLRFDLVMIATLQMLALAYGVYALFESRPVSIVFVKDRFELVRATDYPAPPEGLSWTGPRIVGAKLPTNPKEQFEVMLSSIAGVDVHLMPRYYVPYDDVRALARGKSEPLSTLRERNPARAAEVDALVARSGGREDALRFLPMRAGKADLSVVIDAKTGEVVRISSLKPWGDI